MLSKSAIQDLRIQCATLPVGSRIPQSLCPTCWGGVTKERSFSITVDESGIKFCCHRASCAERGYIQMQTGLWDKVLKKPIDNGLRPFIHSTTELEDWDYAQFEKHYGITSQELIDNSVVKCLERESYVFPIFNIMGYDIGKLERWYSWQPNFSNHRGPKAFYYKETDYPKCYVPKSCSLNDKLVVVEDTLSAIKLGRMFTTCALLGTHLSPELMTKFKEVKVKELVLVLDPDAFSKSISIKKEYALYFDNISTVLLPKDPKDMPYEELQELLCSI